MLKVIHRVVKLAADWQGFADTETGALCYLHHQFCHLGRIKQAQGSQNVKRWSVSLDQIVILPDCNLNGRSPVKLTGDIMPFRQVVCVPQGSDDMAAHICVYICTPSACMHGS